MATLALTQTATAVGTNAPASFLATGGTGPYTYAVASGGAGGTIDPSLGTYRAPALVPSDPTKLTDTIVVTDSLAATASAKILVGSALLLLCDIIQKELGLTQDRVYLWDQKLMQPTDSALYVAVSMPSPRPFGNSRTQSSDGVSSVQSVNMYAVVDIDIISRGPAARDRKEEVILALNSVYAQQQMNANSFNVGTLSTAFVNLNELDGAAIPYRYRISVGMQYTVSKVKATPFYDSNFTPTVIVNA